MTTGDDLLRAIAADPDDDTPRLVYADWLVEHGDPLGELVHVDIALAALPPFHPDRPAFAHRRLELFDAHLRAWWLGWFRWELMWPRFHRGFLEGVHFGATQDFTAFDDVLAEHTTGGHPLLRAGVVRRFGGLQLERAWQLAPELRLREAVEVRVSGVTLRSDAAEQWAALASVRTLRTVAAYGCTDARGFDAILALPELTHLALEKSRVLVDYVARAGVPSTVCSISVAPGDAEPLLETGRFVENTPGDRVLVTDPGRAADDAFVEYPIVLGREEPPVPMMARLRADYERVARPPQRLDDWLLCDTVSPGDTRSREQHGVAVPERAGASETSAYLTYGGYDSIAAAGLAIEDRGPVYCRLAGLTPGRIVMVLWRVDTAALAELNVIAGREDVQHVLPATRGERRFANWVFAIPAAHVRDTILSLTIAAERHAAFALYDAWFYQPA